MLYTGLLGLPLALYSSLTHIYTLFQFMYPYMSPLLLFLGHTHEHNKYLYFAF